MIQQAYVSDEQDGRLRELELAIVDLRGESGSNGKLGNIRAELTAVKEKQAAFIGRFWALVMVVLGGLVGTVIELVLIGRAYGALETQVADDRAALVQLQSLTFARFTPATTPGKDTTP